MTGVRDELLLQLAGVGQGGRHRVERPGEPGDLVVTVLVHGDPDGQVLSAGHVFNGLGEFVHRTETGTGDGEACGAGADDSDTGDEEQDEGQFVEGVLGALERHRDDEPDVGSGRTGGSGAGGNEARHHAYLVAVRVRAVAEVGPVLVALLDLVLVGLGDLDDSRGVVLDADLPLIRDHLGVGVPDEVVVVVLRGRRAVEEGDLDLLVLTGPPHPRPGQIRVQLVVELPWTMNQQVTETAATPNATAAATNIASRDRIGSVRNRCPSLLTPPHPVAVHSPRPGRCAQAEARPRLRLAAEVHHVHVEGVGGRLEVEAPDGLEDLLAGEDLARMREEHLQEGELRAGQLDLAAVAGDLTGREVHAEVGEGEESSSGPAPAAAAAA